MEDSREWRKAAGRPSRQIDAAETERLGAENGTRTFRGELQLAEVAGPVEIAIGLDGDDLLTRVWIASSDAPFFVDREISGIGDRIDVPTPNLELVDAFVGFGTDDLATAGITHPLHITEVPTGWVLAGASIEPDAPSTGCSTAKFLYQPDRCSPAPGRARRDPRRDRRDGDVVRTTGPGVGRSPHDR